jgi:hypothetical protein
MLSSTTTDFSHQSTASTGGYVQDAYPQARYQQGGSQHMWHEEMSSPNSYATYSSAQSPLQSSISSAQTSSQIYGLSLTDQRRTDSTQNGSTQLRIYKPWSRDYEAKTSGPISSQSLTGVSPARQPQHVRAETSQIISAMRDPCACSSSLNLVKN